MNSVLSCNPRFHISAVWDQRDDGGVLPNVYIPMDSRLCMVAPQEVTVNHYS